MATANVTRPEQDPAPRLGVLVVSGLGEAHRGVALARAADALTSHLNRWVSRDGEEERARQERRTEIKSALEKADPAERAVLEKELASVDAASWGATPSVSVHDVDLAPEGDESAQLELRIADPEGPPVRWTLAESWWADDYRPPPVSALTRWLLKVAPVVILRHFFEAVVRRKRERPRRLVWLFRLLAALARLVLAPFLAGLAVLFALVLVAIGSLPIPKLSATVRGATARLGARIGDSYMLIESPTRLGAVVHRVSADIARLRDRFDRVVVIAEGQGAVVAHRALREGAARHIALFVTVGSGLRKVAELDAMARRREGVGLGLVVAGLTLVLVACIAAPFVLDEEDLVGVGVFAALYFGYFLVVLIVILLQKAAESEPYIEGALTLATDGVAPRWADFFASADPVPNGPILKSGARWIESHEVWSTASMLADRRSYWKNPEGFVLPLARLLAEEARSPAAQRALGLDRGRLRAAARRRAWRVGWLVIERGAIVVCALWAGVRLWDDLVSAGEWTADNAPEWTRSVVSTVFKPFRDLFATFGLQTAELVAAALMAAGAGLLYAVVRLCWSGWDRQETTKAFRREPYGLGGVGAGTGLVLTVWSFIVLMQVGAQGSWDAYVDWLGTGDRQYYLGAQVAGFFSWAFVASVGALIAAGPWVRWLLARAIGRDPTKPQRTFLERTDSAQAAGGIALGVVTTVLLLFPSALGDPDLVWPTFALAVALAVLRLPVARLTVGPRRALRERIIAWSVSDQIPRRIGARAAGAARPPAASP